MAYGRTEARALWEDKGRLSRLIIYAANGRIQSESTYGEDPRRYKG